jgi:iron(III) transport system ATP-binding protein
MSTLVVEGVAKAFGGTQVLTDVSLAVPTGGFAAVLGPSGSGKTTLLRVLAGFERPDRGRVTIDDEVIVDGGRSVAAHRRRVGYVPQEGLLFPHLSVAQNVAFGLPRRDRRGARVDELLALIGLAGYADRRPHELSGGQLQRVAVARALAPGPRLILLDEPFAALDASLRDELRLEIKELLAGLGTTVVLVTHDQEEALSLADIVAMLDAGRILQQDAPREIYDAPATLDVAQFLGDANLLDGHVADGTAVTAIGRLEVQADATVEGDAVVLIRPEQILLAAASPNGSSGLVARVVDVRFFGHDAVARLEVEGASPALALTARTRGDLAPRVDARVALTLDGPVRVFRREPAVASSR